MKNKFVAMRGIARRASLFFFFCVFFAGIASAGIWQLHASNEISFEDNIYLTPESEKASLIITPKVGAEYFGRIPESTMEGDIYATAGYHSYSYMPEKNSFPDALIHTHFKNDFFELGDRYIYSSDPASLEITERAKRYKNLVFFSLRTDPRNAIGFGVKAHDTLDYYTSTPFKFLRHFNRNCISLYGLMYYNFSPLTNVFVEYGHHERHYYIDKENNSKGTSIALGMEGLISPVIEAKAKVSYAFRDYRFKLPDAINYTNTLGFNVTVDWKPRSKNEVKIMAQRYLEETVYGENRFFTAFDASIYALHKFTDKYFVSLQFGYHLLDYARVIEGTQRYDNLYSIRPEFGYQFKDWLLAGIWYRHTKRNSTLYAADYLDRTLCVYINMRTRPKKPR